MALRIGELDLDEDNFTLRRAGSTVRIQRKPFDLLCYLAHNRERVVPTRELMARVWEGVSVTDTSLRFCVHALRRALVDSGDQQCYVRTVVGRGYQLTAVTARED